MEIQTIRIGGMTSDDCVERVQDALLNVPHVMAAVAHYPSGSATFDSRETISLDDIAASLEKAGFALLR